MPKNAASSTAVGEPTKVTTVRLVSGPGSTSNKVMPPILSMALVITLIFDKSLPSLKLGTH